MNLKQKGTALITVLMIFAIAVFMAATVMENQQMDIRRTANVMSNDQAMLYALAAEELAKIVLIEDRNQDAIKPKKSGSTESVDGLGDIWNNPALSSWKPIDVGQVRGKLYDLQGKFNINRLVLNRQLSGINGQQPPGQPDVQTTQGTGTPGGGQPIKPPSMQLQTLMDYFKVFPRTDTSISQAFASRVVDWVDSDNVPSGGDNEGEDEFYLTQQPPYKPRNNVFVDSSELRLLLANTPIDEAQWQLFLNEIAILPPNIPLNINTADQYVLEAVLGGRINNFNAAEFVKARENSGGAFESVNDAFAKLGYQVTTSDDLSVNTEYFLLHADAMVDGRTVHLDSVLYRPNAQPKTGVPVSANTNADKNIKVIARKWVKYRPL